MHDILASGVLVEAVEKLPRKNQRNELRKVRNLPVHVREEFAVLNRVACDGCPATMNVVGAHDADQNGTAQKNNPLDNVAPDHPFDSAKERVNDT